MCVSAAQGMDLDDFVEMTKNYAQGIVLPVSQKCTKESDGQVFKQVNKQTLILFYIYIFFFHFNEVCFNYCL